MQKTEDRAARPSKAVIHIRLTPRSSRNEVLGLRDGVFRIKLTAPPVDGKANQALIAFLSKALHVPKGNVMLVSGETSRDKIVRIHGLTGEEVERVLEPGG